MVCMENYKTLMREIKTKIKWTDIFMDGKI